MKLLSIILPTYKRNYELEKILTEYKKNILKFSNIQLIVSNNNPSDKKTEKLVRNILGRNVMYINQGCEKSITYHLFSLIYCSHSKYTWLHSDDDFVIDFNISKIINIVQNNHWADYFFIRTNSVNSRTSKPSKNSLFVENFPWSTLITTTIFRTEHARYFLKSVNLISVYFPLPLFAAISSSGNCVYIEESEVVQGKNFSITDKITKRQMYLYHFFYELLECKTLTREQKTICLRKAAQALNYHIIVQLALFYPCLFFRLVFFAPLLSIYLFCVGLIKALFKIIRVSNLFIKA